jgi:hypothetical protein
VGFGHSGDVIIQVHGRDSHYIDQARDPTSVSRSRRRASTVAWNRPGVSAPEVFRRERRGNENQYVARAFRDEACSGGLLTCLQSNAKR